MTGIACKGNNLHMFIVSGFEPFIKALFWNPVNGADPDPTEFIPFQETVNGFATNAKDILKILNSIKYARSNRHTFAPAPS